MRTEEVSELFTTQEFVIWLMRNLHDRGVRSFPCFPHPLWQKFLYGFWKQFRDLIPGSVDMEFWSDRYHKLIGWGDIGFALFSVTVPMDCTGTRIALSEDELKSKRFAGRFPRLSERIFEEARKIPGFLEFQH